TDGVAAAGGTAPGLVSGDSADAPADTSATGPPSTPADDPATDSPCSSSRSAPALNAGAWNAPIRPGLVSGDSADAPADTSATGPPSTPADDPATDSPCSSSRSAPAL
ncbi:hypothetical protein ACFVTK_25310, partial [Streptomyces sp. NPDC058066]